MKERKTRRENETSILLEINCTFQDVLEVSAQQTFKEMVIPVTGLLFNKVPQ